MSIARPRTKILFLPVIRGNYDPALTKAVKTAVQTAAADLGLDGIFPAEDRYTQGLIRSDDDIAAYYEAWRQHLAEIKALVVISGDFMRERAVQDTVRLLPADVPIFLLVNNDNPLDMGPAKVGDSLCGTLSVHHNVRLLNRRMVRAGRINMLNPAGLKDFLGQYGRIIDGIESLRNMRIGMIGINPNEFATTYTNQVKLFELGFSLHSYELLDLWGDTVLGRQIESGENWSGDCGPVRLRWPIRKNDPRVAETKARFRTAVPQMQLDEVKLDAMARCFLWIQDTYERDRLDTGAIHCWSEFGRYFGAPPCSFAMLANVALKKPLVCEVDVGHAIMARLAWAMTAEAGVILDLNNNGWDPRVFNVFHCSQTPPNWLVDAGRINEGGSVEGVIKPERFTGISAATSSDAFRATVFQGQFLATHPGNRGSSGWAFVPNLPEVFKAIEAGGGIHHFVAMKGHLGAEAAEVLRFQGLEVQDLSVLVPTLSEIERDLPPLNAATAARCTVYSS